MVVIPNSDATGEMAAACAAAARVAALYGDALVDEEVVEEDAPVVVGLDVWPVAVFDVPSLFVMVDRFVRAVFDVPEPEVPEFVAPESWLLEAAAEAVFEVPVPAADAVPVPAVAAEVVLAPEVCVNI